LGFCSGVWGFPAALWPLFLKSALVLELRGWRVWAGWWGFYWDTPGLGLVVFIGLGFDSVVFICVVLDIGFSTGLSVYFSRCRVLVSCFY
jgi:hypothetical protein